MIKLHNISLAYDDRPVLRSCTLRLESGSRAALMGPSGCGKTTLLHIAAGLLTPDAGSVTVQSTVSCVFQEPALFPWLTAAENVNVVLGDSPATMAQAEQWLEAVGLTDCREQYPRQLSGGQKQRVSIARALAYGGDVLLLDEPFRGLDEETRQKIAQLIHREAHGKTLLLATHDPREAELLHCPIHRWQDGKFI